jgi:DNA replication initiation complex subunit (GINS family)
MDKEEINYTNLRKIQQMEQKSPMLTKIHNNFYNNILKYINNLNCRLKKELKSQKQMLLKNEIQNINKIIWNIYEQREKKIFLSAISKARGGNPNLRNLIDAEKDLFDSALILMKQTRKQLLELKSKDINVKDKKNIEYKKEGNKEEKKINENQIVMVTKDIPEFIGTDTKKYNLRKWDIITLPKNMSKMLLKRDVVKEIEKR